MLVRDGNSEPQETYAQEEIAELQRVSGDADVKVV